MHTVSGSRAEKLSAGEGNLPLSGFTPLSPNGTFSGARATVGAAVSDRPRDVRAWAVLYESGTGVRHARESRTTVCRVSVDQIRFNYNFQSHGNDAINIRPNAKDDYDYSNGEWCGGGATNNPACYVGTCRPKVRARFKVEPAGVTGVRIRAMASSQEFTLGDLVGVGRCNNPIYTEPERWRRKCRIEGEVTTRGVYVPRSPMASGDTIDRSMFDSHGFAVAGGLVFDACVGPFCGEHDVTNYLNQVVDQTTEDERLNGFFAPDSGGRIINESPAFKVR